MKKTLLLFLFLLPFLGISQIVDLVKWNAKNGQYTPTTQANITAANITASGGITAVYTNYSGEDVFYQTGTWPNPSQNSGGYDSTKYISLQFTANTGYKLDLTSFSFECRSEGGDGQKFRIKCSTDVNFLTNVYDLANQTSNSGNWAPYSFNFPAALNTVMPDKTMYIRIYAYNTNQKFQLKIGSLAANGGATVKGSISSYSETLVAKDDNATSIKNNFSYIDVVSNDIITSSSKPVTTVSIASQSANGTAVVTSDNKIKFTPTTDYTGTTSFKYTAGDGTTTSTATVYVTVTAPTISSIVKWNGPDTGKPTIIAPTIAVDAEYLTPGSGATLEFPANEGFKGYQWTTQFSIDETKYFQVTTSAKNGYKLKLDKFNFTYKPDPNHYVARYQVRYSKDDFATSFLLVDEATNANTTDKSLDLSNITLYPGEKITLRIYGYKLKPNSFAGSPIFLANDNTKGSGTTPTITGAVLNYDSNDLNANDDLVSTQEKRAISFNPLTNDTNTSGTSIAFTQPTSGTGTVSVNGNVFVFTPAANFKGTTSFTYTLTNGAKSSTATVSVYVNELTPRLIIWNGAVQTPKAVVTDPNLTAADFTLVGNGTNLEIYGNYFNIKGLQNNGSSAENLTRYVQLSVTPKQKYNLTLSQFKFIYNSPGTEGASTFQVRYSKDPNFTDNGTILLGPTTTVKGTDTEVTLNFPSGTRVSSNNSETFYIRIYPYAVENLYNGYFNIKNDYGGDVGPTITGVVEPSNLITANADFITANLNTPTNIPILANDENYTPLVSITATQPTSGGTVTVNGTTNVTFTPSTNFTGTSKFEYTIFNGLNYSTATVTVNVKCQTPGNQIDFGQNKWIGYVYRITNDAAMPPAISYPALPNSSFSTYIGRVTENPNFNRDMGNGPVSGLTTEIPCEIIPIDRFFIRYKMEINLTEAGLYRFDLGSDDGMRLYIDGVEVLSRWNDRGYATDYFTQNLSAGNHKFVLEYFENGGLAQNSFFYGKPVGDPSQFGDKVWNVYGYENNDITLQNVKYSGYYVDPNLSPDSTNFWPKVQSPSAAATWQGSKVPDDNFTTVYKRKGFDCGRYQLQHLHHDDIVEIYIDGTRIYKQDVWDPNYSLINNGKLYSLNSNSQVEIRVGEYGGDASLGINFVKTNVTYTDGTGDEAGSNLVINGNKTLTSDLEVCSCTINPGFTLTVQENVTLTINEDIKVGSGGKLLILDNGSLLQTTTSQTMFTGDATNAFEFQRKATVSRYDLTYWSMPVTADNSFTMKKFSPDTLFDKYFTFDAKTTSWAENLYGTLPMVTGKGYSIRAPQSHDANIKTDFTGVFIGTPNNGNINVAVESGAWNLIGNPYPSAVDADQFLSDNSGIGTLYFWEHVNLPIKAADGYYYYTDDFIVYNGLGSIDTGNANAFKGYIAAAQSFFIKAPVTTTVNFNNDQREKGKNTQFYKTAKSDIEKNRVWVNFKNTNGIFKQILVGYATGATNTTDADFDALSMESNPLIDFYSINNSKKLSIQGRALPFVKSDVVTLGYRLADKGDYTISIDHADGLFNDGQDIYLEDKTTGKTTNLRLADYTFTTDAGTFNKRFVIRYTDKTLGVDDFDNNENSVLVSIKSKIITINSTAQNISQVEIYNIGGQSLYTKNKIDSKDLQIPNLQSSNQVLLVKVILENGAAVTKKIIFN